jgi:WD40 repeat protein
MSNKKEQRLRRLRERVSPFYLWERLQDIFSGYDYFIAHRSVDGKTYAHSLYQRLTQPGIGFSCFIDSQHYPAGGNLLWLQDRALRKSARLIVIVTEQAYSSRQADGSDYLVNEIRQFKRSKGRVGAATSTDIIPISTSMNVSSSSFRESHLANELPSFPKTLWIMENPENFLPSSDGPSELTIAKLVSDFKEQKQSVKRSRWLKGFSTMLLVLVAALAVFALYAFEQRNVALSEKQTAQLNEAKGWLLQAKLNPNTFPNRAFYAARALGFKGLGFETASTSFKKSQPSLLESVFEPKFVNSCLREVQDVITPLWSNCSSSIHFRLTAMASSDSFEWIATGSTEGSLRIWSKRTGDLIREIAAHDGEITRLLDLHNASKLVSASQDATVKIWDVKSGRCDQTFKTGKYVVYGVALSSDERTLYSGGGGEILAWDVKTGRLLSKLREGPGSIIDLALSPGDRYLAVSFGENYRDDTKSPENIIEIWDLASNRLDDTLVGSSSFFRDITFSPDGKFLASGSFDGSVKLWDMRSRAVVRTLKGHDGSVNRLSFSKDSGLLLSGGWGGQIVLWDPVTGDKVKQIDSHSTIIFGLTFIDEGRTVLSADMSGGLHFFDLHTNALPNSISGHSDTITSVASLNQGHEVVSASADGALKFWKMDDGSPTGVLPIRSTIKDMIVSSDQGRVYILADDTIQEWSLKTRQMIMHIRGDDLSFTEIHSIAISQSGRLLACGGQTKEKKVYVAILDLQTGRLIRKLEGHEKEINGLCFRGDDLVISGSDDQTIRTWSLTRPDGSTVFKTLAAPPQLLRLDPTGTYLAVATMDKVHVWDLSGNELTTFRGHQGRITALNFSADGRYLASGANDKLIGLWDLKNPGHVKMLSGHTEAVTALAFDEEGRYLISGSADYSVKVWDIQNHALSKRLFKLDDSINDFSVRTDSSLAIGVSTKGYIQFWNLSSALPMDTINVGAPLRLAATTNDGRLLASTGSDNSVKIWKTAPLVLLRTLTTDYPVRKLEFSDNGGLFQVLTGDSIKIYVTANWKQLEGLTLRLGECHDMTFGAMDRQSAVSIQSVGFQPSQVYLIDLNLEHQGASRSLKIPNLGSALHIALANQANVIAFVTQDRIQVWDTQKTISLASLTDKTSTSLIAMNPAGDLVANGTTGNQINIWSVGAGEVQNTLTGHVARVNYLSFLKDGKSLVAVDANNDVLLWNVEVRRPNLAQFFDAGWYEFDSVTGQVQSKILPLNLYGHRSPAISK